MIKKVHFNYLIYLHISKYILNCFKNINTKKNYNIYIIKIF